MKEYFDCPFRHPIFTSIDQNNPIISIPSFSRVIME